MTRRQAEELLEAVRGAWSAAGRALETDRAAELLESDGRGDDELAGELEAVDALQDAETALARAAMLLELAGARRALAAAEYALERAQLQAAGARDAAAAGGALDGVDASDLAMARADRARRNL